MENRKKYTYKNWWEGEIALNSCETKFHISNPPIIISWDDFEESEISKIKEKQKEIFDNKVLEKFTEFQNVFLSNYENSLMKNQLLIDEIQQCNDIMFARIPHSKIITLDFWDFTFEYNDLQEIQRYIKKTIKRGIQDGYDFIHSPFFKFQNFNKIPSQIYAKVIWEFSNWLKSLETMAELSNDSINLENENYNSVNRLWFKVGILFATGKMDELFKKHKMDAKSSPNFTQIAKELGNLNFRPYISESYSRANISNKNIFGKKNKVEIILNYCNENSIKVCESFNEIINSNT